MSSLAAVVAAGAVPLARLAVTLDRATLLIGGVAIATDRGDASLTQTLGAALRILPVLPTEGVDDAPTACWHRGDLLAGALRRRDCLRVDGDLPEDLSHRLRVDNLDVQPVRLLAAGKADVGKGPGRADVGEDVGMCPR